MHLISLVPFSVLRLALVLRSSALLEPRGSDRKVWGVVISEFGGRSMIKTTQRELLTEMKREESGGRKAFLSHRCVCLTQLIEPTDDALERLLSITTFLDRDTEKIIVTS